MALQIAKWRPSLKRWVLISAILPALLLVIMSLWGIPKALDYAYQRQQEALIEPLIDQTLRALQPAWLQQDRLSMSETLGQLVARPSISGAMLTQMAWERPIEKGVMAKGVHYSAQLIVGDEVAGKLVVSVSPDILSQAKSQVMGVLLSAALLVMVLGAALGVWWWHRIQALFQDATLQWQRLPDTFLPIRKSFSEFDALNAAAQHVHQTHVAEQEAKRALARFMSTSAEDTLELNMPASAQLRSVTVLYIDLINWRDIKENATPKQLVQLLNQYYFFVRQAAKLYNGEVERYQGQGLTVTFGLDDTGQDKSFHAICAGELFLELVYRFNVHHQMAHAPVCEFSLALHAGEVLCNAEEQPLEDSVRWSTVGDVLHHAALLGQHSEQRLLVSGVVLSECASLGQRIQFSDHESVQCDPRDPPLPTHWVDCLNAPYVELVQRQAERILSMKPILTA